MKSHSAESIAGTHPSAPDGWRVDNFERLAVLQRGFDLPSSARTTGDVPIIGSNGIVGWHSEARVHGPGVVTGRSGSIGESTYVEGDYWPLNTSLYVSHFHDNIPRFVHYFIQWFDLSRFASGVSVPTLNRNAVYGTEVKIPSPTEQEKIAAVLWKLQRAIATQHRLIAATRDLKQSAMHRLFTQGLRGESLKETKIGSMPESWRIESFVNVARLERGRFTHRPRNEPRFYGGNTPFVQTGDVVRGQGQITTYTQTLNTDGVAISRVFPTGTILITIAANIGFTGILNFDSACPDSLVGITPRDFMSGQFLAYYLQLQQPEMDRQAPKGTQKNINLQFLEPWPVAVPGLEEQREIAAALTTIDRKLAHHQKKRAALNDLFQTLLHKLMTGEIRVAEIDIDTSEITAPPGATA